MEIVLAFDPAQPVWWIEYRTFNGSSEWVYMGEPDEIASVTIYLSRSGKIQEFYTLAGRADACRPEDMFASMTDAAEACRIRNKKGSDYGNQNEI